MPIKTKTKKAKTDKVLSLSNDPVTPVVAELDDEVLEALNAKKIKKVKVPKEVDYIPELERDDSLDFGASDDE